jgi:putative ABC transport system substrate-binding protein
LKGRRVVPPSGSTERDIASLGRRHFLIASGALLAAPLTVEGQQPGKVAHIGILTGSHPGNSIYVAETFTAFYAELKARGWEEGRNLLVETRYAGVRAEKYSIVADEFVSAGVDVIVTINSQAVDAARKATRTIPIVMTGPTHAVEPGYVVSLAHPGGNITGVINQSTDLNGKQFELLFSIRPDMRKMGLMWSPNNRGSALGFKDMQVVARGLSVALVSLPVDAIADVGPALAKAQHEGVQTLFVHPTSAVASGFREIESWATKNRVITGSQFGGFTRAGFLLSYAADFKDLWRISATYIDRILRGAKPAELPVQRPTKFELIVNLKTARAIGVTIPQSIMLRADQVIE